MFHIFSTITPQSKTQVCDNLFQCHYYYPFCILYYYIIAICISEGPQLFFEFHSIKYVNYYNYFIILFAGNQLSGPLPQQLQNQISGPMQGNLGNMNSPIPGQMQNQMLGHMQIQRKPNDGMMMNAQPGNFPRNPTPTQYLRQSPTPSVQSPVGLGCAPQMNQMVPSPVLAPSPGSQLNMIGGPQRSVGMAPSPSNSLNTPGQPNQSPIGMQEEQAYREKVRQLSIYIEPLRKMVARMGNDGERELLLCTIVNLFYFPTIFEYEKT